MARLFLSPRLLFGLAIVIPVAVLLGSELSASDCSCNASAAESELAAPACVTSLDCDVLSKIDGICAHTECPGAKSCSFGQDTSATTNGECELETRTGSRTLGFGNPWQWGNWTNQGDSFTAPNPEFVSCNQQEILQIRVVGEENPICVITYTCGQCTKLE